MHRPCHSRRGRFSTAALTLLDGTERSVWLTKVVVFSLTNSQDAQLHTRVPLGTERQEMFVCSTEVSRSRATNPTRTLGSADTRRAGDMVLMNCARIYTCSQVQQQKACVDSICERKDVSLTGIS